MGTFMNDFKGRSAVVPLEFLVLPVDEFPPVFSHTSYTFQIPLNVDVGAIVGEVQAVDADGGVHGVPRYRIEPPNALVSVEANTGQVYSISRGQAKERNGESCCVTRLACSPKPALPSNVPQQYTQSRHTAPTFQPLTEIFDELEEIQREQGRKREYIQVEI
ncbi:unnamed protein product [Strongylus vulgaris]|uniref:Cadherin domain-containing protein n=1 Tax=Strongylus vulgaris TaxID=40348 RepID=A0A3P7LJP4_STRVU|nr:unnamed protein product [Strongylus vulgaris]